MSFRKHAGRPGAAEWEAAGLRWLAGFGAVPVVRVEAVDGDLLVLEHLSPVAPTRMAAEDFGRSLARLHSSRVSGFGCPPDGWEGPGWLGPNDDLLPAALETRAGWAEHWVEDCLRPTAEVCLERGRAGVGLLRAVDRFASVTGQYDTEEPASPVHGDLWAGNVVWTAEGATLVDPSAHGGHRELDLALLALFGFPHLDVVLGAYQEVSPLVDGWERRLGVHQLHHLLVHVACFGGGYLAQTMAALEAAVG